jgi:hypothetical protein
MPFFLTWTRSADRISPAMGASKVACFVPRGPSFRPRHSSSEKIEGDWSPGRDS